MRFYVLIPAISLTASGCVSLPSFDQISGVTPKTIVDVIECELFDLREKLNAACSEEKYRRNQCERLEHYKAVAELSLQVDSQLTLAPSFTHTDVVSKTLTLAFDWGPKFEGKAQRTYSQSITFEISAIGRKLNKEQQCYTTLTRKIVCDEPLSRVSLNGKLGLEEIVDMAFHAVDPAKHTGITTGAPKEGNGGDDSDGQPRQRGPRIGDLRECPTPAAADRAKITLDKYLSESPRTPYAAREVRRPKSKGGRGNDALFSTSIEFVVLLGLNSTGPTWTLSSHFKGPGKLFSVQNANTHGVTIAFSKDEGAAKSRAFNDDLKRVLKQPFRQP